MSRPVDSTGGNRTTASTEAVLDVSRVLREDPTPGLVLVYARSYDRLPGALALHRPVMEIGREPSCDLVLPEASVSRVHARLERRGDGWWIVDAGSTNGVLVGGTRVDAQRLAPHDVIRIGDAVMRFADRQVRCYAPYRIDGGLAPGVQMPVDVDREASTLLVGGYPLEALRAQLARIATAPISVVVRGESGTGKELVAREVHRASGRRGAFQAINCAALPAHLVESELFGYRKGAFTGATQDKPGLVRAAHGGTLFLDEIGDMPLEAQAKLLRVLQERELLPLGATSPERVDVRVVAATHRDLDALVADGKFRGDLLARLREFTATLPPLRERREDLFRLVLHFLAKSGHGALRPSFRFMLAVTHYAWPYNVRELESAVKVAVAQREGPDLDLHHLPEQVRAALDHHGERAPSRTVARTTRAGRPTPHAPFPAPSAYGAAPTEEQLRALLARHAGNVAAVGRELGKERMQIHRWMKRYGIDVDDYRRDGA
jgi:DNA-binding NtrC family response regulator